LLIFLTAHLIADFPLQPDWLIRRKRHFMVLLAHAAIVAGVAIFLLGGWPITLLLILIGTQIVMDAIKVYLLPDTLRAFLLDQAVHITVIVGLAVSFTNVFWMGWWAAMPHAARTAFLVGLVLISGLIASLPMGAILIRKLTADFDIQTVDQIECLENGGRYTGLLERALVMLLILIGQPAGVGFLITAKSILRFGDVRETSQRKMTEYIIIGTFMSFGWGLLIAVLTRIAFQHWLPATSA
tara:strand:- start:982 stop:1704 length:723 start_codon:yes stop_codon:yes gene_type:complete